MAKIVSKATLVLGTNYKYHLVDKQGTDIQIDVTGGNIISSTTDFLAQTDVAGIVKRGIAVGDVIRLTNTTNSANEGVTATVNTVGQFTMGVTFDGAPVDEAAGADINILAFKKTYQFLAASGLDFVDGVSGLVWASKTVDDWDTGNLDIYDSVFTSIEPRAKSIASKDGWEPHDISTLKAIRDTALEIRPSANGAATRIYSLPRSNDLHAATDQFTFWPASQAELTAPLVAVTQGYYNELVLIYDVDGADDRGIWNFRCLEPGKTHLQEQIDMQYAEIYPVGSKNGIDPKLADGAGTQFVDDGTVVGGIYANILLNVDVDSQYDGDVDSVLYSFVGFVDNDSQTLQNTHTKVHYLLRQAVNINNDGTGPTLRGDKQPPVTSYLGETITFDKYYPLNYNTAERNSIIAKDDGGVNRVWPSIMTLTVDPDTLALTGTFSVMHEDTFGASSPTYLQNESAVAQQDIAMPGAVPIVIAFSTYNVDGHTPGTPIPVRISYNRPGFIEPRNVKVVLTGINQIVPISSIADPSYTAA